jgi:hypothetical protein
MHDLRTERFFKPEMINYAMAVRDGSIKTFALRGAEDNPPKILVLSRFRLGRISTQ